MFQDIAIPDYFVLDIINNSTFYDLEFYAINLFLNSSGENKFLPAQISCVIKIQRDKYVAFHLNGNSTKL